MPGGCSRCFISKFPSVTSLGTTQPLVLCLGLTCAKHALNAHHSHTRPAPPECPAAHTWGRGGGFPSSVTAGGQPAGLEPSQVITEREGMHVYHRSFLLFLPEVSDLTLCLCHASSLKMLLAFQQVPKPGTVSCIARKGGRRHGGRYGVG